MTPTALSEVDRQQLAKAKSLLEASTLAAKITNVIGSPIEKGFEMLPAEWSEKLTDVTRSALMKAADAAIFTMKDAPGVAPSNFWHKLGAAASGGVGGFFGIAAIAIELPVSTTIMLRSIADIARSEGESIEAIDTKLACLEVFALGGRTSGDNAAETGYFAVRTVMAKSVSDAAEFVARKGLTDKAAPALVRFFTQIAEKFGVQVSQKAAAQAVPAIGAAGGALINTLFIDHFQDMARGHFIVRRLEREYGAEAVRAAYDGIQAS